MRSHFDFEKRFLSISINFTLKASFTVSSSKKYLSRKRNPSPRERTSFSSRRFSLKCFPLVGSDMGLEDTIEAIRSWGPETGSEVGWIGNQWSHPKWRIKVNSPPQPCPTEVINSLNRKQPGDHSRT